MTNFDFPEATEILGGMVRDDEFPDNLDERATVEKEIGEIIDFTVTTELYVTEEVSERTLSASSYEKRIASDIPYDRRYEGAPSDFQERTIKFIKPADVKTCKNCGGDKNVVCGRCEGAGKDQCRKCRGSQTVECPNCSGGKERCGNCNGSGTLTEKNEKQCPRCKGEWDRDWSEPDCPRCRGKGVVTEEVEIPCPNCTNGKTQCEECWGDGFIKCPSCGGSGIERCSKCSGNGRKKCGRCNGEGKTATTIVGKLKFQKSVEFSSEQSNIPIDLLESSDGKLVGEVREDPEQISSGTPERYRSKVEERLVPAKYIEYTFRDQNYQALYVNNDGEAELRHPSQRFPKSEEHYRTQVSEAIHENTFDYGASENSIGFESIWKDAKAVGYFSVVTFILWIPLALIFEILIPIFHNVPENSLQYAYLEFAVGLIVLFGILYFWESGQDSEVPDNPTDKRYTLIVPIILLGLGGWIIFSGDFNYRIGLVAILIGSASWVRQLGERIKMKAWSAGYIQNKRQKVLDRADIDNHTLSFIDLSDLLPSPRPNLRLNWSHRFSRLLLIVGWGTNVFFIPMAVLGPPRILPSLEYIPIITILTSLFIFAIVYNHLY